jgi:membrane dipeptidase
MSPMPKTISDRAPIFDGHNDALFRLWRSRGNRAAAFAGSEDGHVNLKSAQAGRFAGGLFAIFVPEDGPVEFEALLAQMRTGNYDIPLPPQVPRSYAQSVTLSQAAILLELDRAGYVALCRTAADVRAAMAANRIAAVMHIEGAEAIGPDLDLLDVLHAAGLRSVGPVWSRPTIFGYGVPLRHPGHGDIGPGLTAAGKALVQRVGKLRMLLDTSHLNIAGFRDVAELGLPLVASHSNAHAICPNARNLTDDQLRAIGETRGMVGLNLVTSFLRPDGKMLQDGAYDAILPHLEHMMSKAGEDHVGLGSDFDGGLMPQEIATAAGLDAFRALLDRAGYSAELRAKICHRNWINALERIWGR